MAQLKSKAARLLLTVTALASLVVLLSGTSALSAAALMMPSGPDWSPMHGGTGHNLRAVWGSSDNDVFAVGHSGTILHYNGKKWRTMKSGTKDSIYGVWGSSASDVFAVGDMSDHQPYDLQVYILHYDGSSWSTMSSPSWELYGVWGSSASDVFAVGWTGSILHYDGSTWSIIFGTPGCSLHAIWGSSGNSVFAVGRGYSAIGYGDSVSFGAILHYDGSTWTTMESSTTNELRGVWGSSDNNVFAVGLNGTILHYDGSEWSTVTSGIAPDLYAVWGSSDSDVFAVGDLATVLHYDGNTWERMSVSGTRTGSSSIRSTDSLHGVCGSSENDVFAVGSETILHHPGHFTTISKGVNWGLVGRIMATVVLVGTVLAVLWLIDRRGRGKTVKDK